MTEKKIIDYAYDVLSKSKKAMSFKDIFKAVVKLSKKNLTDAELKQAMSKLYTDLTIDGRFTSLEGNVWDLRSRRTFEESHIDINELVMDEEDEVDEEEKKLLQEELGEVAEEPQEESDDLDFDKPKQSNEADDEF